MTQAAANQILEPTHVRLLPVFEVFYDGDCPLCRREMHFLRRRNRRQQLRLTDICLPEFDAKSIGRTHEELMARIHGRLSDGTIVAGVEVFRQIYLALGWTWLVAVTRLPLIRQMLDVAYAIFARNRMRLTGRCTDQTCSVRK